MFDVYTNDSLHGMCFPTVRSVKTSIYIFYTENTGIMLFFSSNFKLCFLETVFIQCTTKALKMTNFTKYMIVNIAYYAHAVIDLYP